MFSEFKHLDHTADVAYEGAPSLPAAVRKEAEDLARLQLASGKAQSIGCLTKHLLGDVEADIFALRGDRVLVEFYTGAKKVLSFAAVTVHLSI